MGQSTASRTKKILVADSVDLDSLSIYPNSFEVYYQGSALSNTAYKLDFTSALFVLNETLNDSLTFIYQVLPLDLSKQYKLRDTSIIYSIQKDNYSLFKIENSYSVQDVFGGSQLNKNGSISRGVSFGNNQDLGINSSLNLELSGNISPDLKMLASISDANIPIQPDGNTNKLQEFDKVFIQIYNDQFKLIAGDFWLSKPKGYFMNYRKRAQGLSVNYIWKTAKENEWSTQTSGALSKGKFNRQIIQGVEANQGPYRLVGAENEPFIIVLSGTEKVFIDGKLLERGQEFDYTIDYNSSEVVFTSRNLITKDTRIVVEFQYSDQNYARSLVQESLVYKGDKMEFWMNMYGEQDAKNQPLQQEISPEQRFSLSQIGDSLNLAKINSIDSVGYFDNQNLYKLIDSLGVDSVLVFSVNADSAFYRVYFEYAGSGNGDYVLDEYNALGKVYRWVAPVAGVSQGDHVPSRSIITPKKKQMLSTGIRWNYSKNNSIESEWAISNNDLNTFSSLASNDDIGVSNRTRWLNTKKLGESDSTALWILKSKAEIEYLSASFTPIQQYRAVEFDRDWNTRNKGYQGYQLIGTLGSKLTHKKHGSMAIDAQHFGVGEDYNGNRIYSLGKWKQEGWAANWDASYLSAEAESKSSFFRHRLNLSKNIGPFKLGYKDDHERNIYTGDTNAVDPSYEFFDYQFYVSNHDTSKLEYKVYYRERFDRRIDNSALKKTAKATTAGAELYFNSLKNQKLRLIAGYRSLDVLDTVLMNQNPENSLIGRIEYNFKAWKNALQWSTFYEVGSGLEQKKEFLYIQVNSGQGIYTWIDYNEDGIKDLNEFEIAQYADQADYIRVFVPSNTYVNTYSNEFNQSFYWRPERIWAKKKGFLGFMSRFSDQARFRVNKKTNSIENGNVFNPFENRVADSALISTNAFIRNALFFNRTSSIFAAGYNFQQNQSKTLLASGFDSRTSSYNELNLRWNMTRKFALILIGQQGVKQVLADYTSGRDYSIDYQWLKSTISYQPSTNFRLTLETRGVTKENIISGGAGETCQIIDMGSTFKYNQTDKGSLQGELKVLKINYDGNVNSAIGFEMLEALRPGINYTWTIGYQKTVSKNLQITFQYLGRKSEDTRIIHTGGMEIRAFF
jgi:hypothetical protein